MRTILLVLMVLLLPALLLTGCAPLPMDCCCEVPVTYHHQHHEEKKDTRTMNALDIMRDIQRQRKGK